MTLQRRLSVFKGKELIKEDVKKFDPRPGRCVWMGEGPKPKEEDKCGPSVYGPLSRAVNEIRAWWTRNPDKHEKVCEAISFRLGNIYDMAMTSWEVPQLHNTGGWIGPYQQEEGCATPGTECEPTIWLQGRCWHSADVAYVAFGAMRKLCGFGRMSTGILAEAAKLPYGTKHQAAARYWAEKGWLGWPAGGEPPLARDADDAVMDYWSYPGCARCTMRYDAALPGGIWMFQVDWGGEFVT